MKTAVASVATRLLIFSTLLIGAECALGQNAEDCFLNSNGARIRYQVWGRGTPVVLVHGFGETLESWHRGEVIRTLSQHFQVIVMDVRGHGLSSKPHDQKSYGLELSADVARLLQHLGHRKAHIVGYSMGALVALDFAILHQRLTLSIVLGGAGWNPPEVLDEFKQQAQAFEQGKVPLRKEDDPVALSALLRSLRVLREEEVRGIRGPITALIGTNDRFMPNVQRLSRVLPGLHVNVINGADHATAPSHPTFAKRLLTILLEQDTERRKIRATSGFNERTEGFGQLSRTLSIAVVGSKKSCEDCPLWGARYP